MALRTPSRPAATSALTLIAALVVGGPASGAATTTITVDFTSPIAPSPAANFGLTFSTFGVDGGPTATRRPRAAADRCAAGHARGGAAPARHRGAGRRGHAAGPASGVVRMLLIVDDLADRRTAWFEPEVVCSIEQPGTIQPGHAARAGHRVDVAVRAALLTRAEVRVLTAAEGAGLAGGIAALRRHT